MERLRAVIFDWRGTLAMAPHAHDWVRIALRRAGRDHDPRDAAELWDRIVAASQGLSRLEPPGVDSDAALHRETYYRVFADAGLDAALADQLYAVESDPSCNPFAVDAAPVLGALSAQGVRLAVVSDIHFDIRPAFAAEGLAGIVDSFVLSYEHRVQKPDPAIFALALDALGSVPEAMLMVGDRNVPDGAAVTLGMATLLVPTLRDVNERRLHLVQALLAAAGGS